MFSQRTNGDRSRGIKDGWFSSVAFEPLEERRLLTGAIAILPNPVSGGLVAPMQLSFPSVTEAQNAVITIKGPDSYDQNAAFLSYAPGTGGGTDAIYDVNAPTASDFSGSDDGYYDVYESTVADPASSTLIGVFAIKIADGDTQPPTYLLGRRPTLTTSQSGYTFAVAYNDNVAVAENSVVGVVEITGPGHFSQYASASAPLINDYGQQIVVDYTVSSPSGTRDNWTAINNGIYDISITPGAVKDLAGNAMAGGLIGSFTVNIPKAVDTTPPVAKFATGPTLNRSGTEYFVSVTYTDNEEIHARSIDSSNVTIIGRHAFSEPVTLVTVRENSIASYTATYGFPVPPAGGYVVEMQAHEVDDEAGNYVAAGALETISIPAPAIEFLAAPLITTPTPAIHDQALVGWFAMGDTPSGAFEFD